MHGLIDKPTLEYHMRILFVCIGNTCRSQMAEAIARHLGYESASAGTHPGKHVSENALKVLNEMKINSEGLHPKSIDVHDWKSFDMVISMGCGVNCPTIKIDQDWGLEDPFGEPLESFKNCANNIIKNIKTLTN